MIKSCHCKCCKVPRGQGAKGVQGPSGWCQAASMAEMARPCRPHSVYQCELPRHAVGQTLICIISGPGVLGLTYLTVMAAAIAAKQRFGTGASVK